MDRPATTQERELVKDGCMEACRGRSGSTPFLERWFAGVESGKTWGVGRVHCADEGWNSQTSLHLDRDSIWTLVRSEFAVGFDGARSSRKMD
jgi:hypothetical protein